MRDLKGQGKWRKIKNSGTDFLTLIFKIKTSIIAYRI